MTTPKIVVIGAGIVGLATARAIQERKSRAAVLVVDKEAALGLHQTGRNSGVIHSGIYYRPGSLKAKLCLSGRDRLIRYADSRGITYEICGKLLVATRPDEIDRLDALLQRAQRHGLTARRISTEQIKEIEPHVSALAAGHVAETGIIDYREVCAALSDDVAVHGGEIKLASAVKSISSRSQEVVVETDSEELRADFVVNCAGLYSDRIAHLAGAQTQSRIIPFRGEYFELRPGAHHLVKNLIYPVPDPDLPFLGVHLTRMIGGGVHAGPNAVLALAREGYRWRSLNARDLAEMALFPGAWRLARTHWRVGASEAIRSLNKRQFLSSLQRLVPELLEEHLQPAPAGVRAQAVARDGSLLDDFEIVRSDRITHVLNAPSPAATSALSIGHHLASLLPES